MNRHLTALQLVLPLLLIALAAATAGAQDISEETVTYFQQNCTSCHTIGGGRLAGPDLKGAHERRERDWLVRFVMDPKGVIDGGDPVGQELLREAKGVYMTAPVGITRDRVNALIDLIAVESAKEKSRFAGLQLSDRPLTPADIELGQRIYSGNAPLVGGGPACIACHDLQNAAGLGGGRLGPDLTDVYSRLEGRKALSAWLATPPSLTMQPIYQEHPLESDEVLALVAYLKSTAETSEPAGNRGAVAFLLAGLSAMTVLLVAFDLIWRNRFRAVRRPLVEGLSR